MVTSKSSRRLAWLAPITLGDRARSSAPRRRDERVDPGVLGDDVPGPRAQHRVGRARATVGECRCPQRADHLASAAATLGRPLRVGAWRRAMRAAPECDHHAPRGRRGAATGSTVQRGAVDAAAAWPAHPRRAGQLVHDPAGHAGRAPARRAGRAAPARARRPSNPRASATATLDSAAEDDNPAPDGQVGGDRPREPLRRAQLADDAGDVAGPRRLEGARIHVRAGRRRPRSAPTRPSGAPPRRRPAPPRPWCRGRWPSGGRVRRCGRCGRRSGSPGRGRRPRRSCRRAWPSTVSRAPRALTGLLDRPVKAPPGWPDDHRDRSQRQRHRDRLRDPRRPAASRCCW